MRICKTWGDSATQPRLILNVIRSCEDREKLKIGGIMTEANWEDDINVEEEQDDESTKIR